MTLIFMIVFMIVLDRLFPFNIRQFGRKFFETNSSEFYSRYGWIAFPRTIFLILSCAPEAISYIYPIDYVIKGLISISFVTLWGISAFVDVLRARK